MDNLMIVVDEVRFKKTGRRNRTSGLLAFISFRLNGCLRIDGVTLRRTTSGDLALSFPERRDRSGQCHQIVRPLSDRTRSDIEQQVFAQLRLAEATPR